MTIRMSDAEYELFGMTFVVDYDYYDGIPSNSINPSDPPEVDILNVTIKDQPSAEAWDLLAAIKLVKSTPSDKWEDGFDLIIKQILKDHLQ